MEESTFRQQSPINPGELNKRGERKRKDPKHLPAEWFDERREEVFKMASYGMTDHEIEDVYQISNSLLRSHFRNELDKGRALVRQAIRKAQLEKGVKEKCSRMLIWLGKMYLGQSEPNSRLDVEHVLKVQPVYYAKGK